MSTFELSKSTLIVLCLIGLFLISYVSAEMLLPQILNKSSISDFEAFHLAGTMIWQEGSSSPYDVNQFVEKQRYIPGFDGSSLLWSYPPTFSVIAAVLALLPVWLSYGLFMAVTLTAYLWIVKRLSGPHYHLMVILLLPLLALEIRSGQNGLLTGFLVGLTCLLCLRSTLYAGVPLGLMVIKPHLALGLGFSLLLKKAWGTAGLSIGVAILACAISWLLLGSEAWAAFLVAIKTAGDALVSGGLPLYRLASVFASGLSFGLPSNLAMALHMGVLVLFIAGLIFLAWRKAPLRYVLAFGVMTSAMMSPYAFDYDLAMLAVSAALLIDPIIKHGTPIEHLVLMCGVWFIGCYGMIATVVEYSLLIPFQTALIGPTLVIIAAILFGIMLRSMREATSQS